MPRFIVRVHTDIEDNKRWRSGVLLSHPAFGATALVRADFKANRIYVDVRGPQNRDYFSHVRKVITDINNSFEKLSVKELVPLPDHPEILIDYQELLGHEKAGMPEMFVGRLGIKYDVQKLLNGMEAPRLRRTETIVHVEGNYFASPTTVISNQTNEVVPKTEAAMKYQAASWEKAIVFLCAMGFLGLLGFLLVRNQPIADPNLVVALRLILSLVVAVLGGTIPGLLHVDLSSHGLKIRAAGALALFVLAYFGSPQVLNAAGR